MNTAVITPPDARVSGSGSRLRTISRRVVLAGGILFLLLGLLAGYAQAVIISDSGFADHATASLDYPGVKSAVSQVIVARLLQNAPPKLQVAEPVLQNAVETVVGSTRFKTLFRASLHRTHQVLLSQHNNRIALNLSKQAPLILGVLQTRSPELASRLQASSARLKKIRQNNVLLPIIELFQRIRVIEIVAPILSLLCFLLVLVLAVDRRRALHNIGLSIAIPAAIVWLLLALGEWLGPSFVSSPLALALPGLWAALLGDLRRWSVVLVIAGLAVVAISHASGKSLDAQMITARTRHWMSGVDSGPWRLPMLAIGAVVTGLLLLFNTSALFRLLSFVLGAGAIYLAVYAASNALAPKSARVSSGSLSRSDQDVGAGGWGAVAVVLVAVLLLWFRNVWTA